MSYYNLPLVFQPQPEGGYTVTCPILPELLTEGDTLEEARASVSDALAAVLEIYQETGKQLPSSLRKVDLQELLWSELLVQVP